MTAAGAVIAGLALGCFQGSYIAEGLSYCLNADVIYDDPGPRFAAMFELAARTIAYGVILPVAATPFLIAATRTARRRWIAGAAAASLACGAVLFVVDYDRSNKIEFYAKADGIAAEVAERCPGNRPPWWPF